MSTNYKHIPAVGQYDENSCWAASLEWWLRAQRLMEIYQDDVLGDYMNMRGDGGSLNFSGIIQLIEDPRWCMQWVPYYSGAQLTSGRLKSLLASGPVYIGYKDNTINSNHVNVIYRAKGSGSSAKVYAMEPHHKAIGAGDPGYFGSHVKRRLDYYTSNEVHIGIIRGSYSTGTGYDETYDH